MIELRPYQTRLIELARKSFAAGYHAPLIVSPTGSGKTIVFAEICRGAVEHKNRTLVIVHRQEIMEQTRAKLYSLGVSSGLIAPGRPPTAEMVQVAMIQTLVRRLSTVRRPDLIILDEAHHCVSANSHGRALAYWKEVPRLGFTATPSRADGVGLREMFDDLIIGPTVAELVKDGFLSYPVLYAPPGPGVDYHVKRGDFDTDEQQKAMSARSIVGDVISHYRRHFNGAPAICFCVNVEHSRLMARQFSDAGYLALPVYGDMPNADREAALDGLREGSVQVVTSCDLISEGFDTPAVAGCILLRRTMSLGLYLQQCLDARTEILTRDGWKGEAQIQKSDAVAAFDAETGGVQWRPIQRIVRRPLAHDEPMFAIQGPHLDIRVTGGHEMLVRGTGETCVNWQKREAGKVAQRASMSRIPISGIERAPGARLSDDEIRFLGWFLTDGTRNKITNAVMIAQSSAKEKHCAEIERVLKACGFKYGTFRSRRKGADAKYPDLLMFSVSRGLPRGTKKILRGWAKLAPWIDKSLPEAYETLDCRQVGILIEAMNLGDGQNQNENRDWTPHTLNITTGDNRIMADRLQSLLVRRGFKCNLAVYEANGRGPWYTLHIKPGTPHATIAGSGNPDGSMMGKKEYQRSRFNQVKSNLGETVWCVTNDLGTLITRRNGKVAILGNCGRALRTFEGKTRAVILDHAGNYALHGHVMADRAWSLDSVKRDPRKEKVPQTTACPKCYAILPGAPRRCEYCGWEFTEAPARKGKDLETIEGELVEAMPDLPPADAAALAGFLARTQYMAPAQKARAMLGKAFELSAGGEEGKRRLAALAAEVRFKPSWVNWATRFVREKRGA